MANKEQVELLKKGVEVWNKWRDEHPDVRIDLRGAKLSEADLHGANLDAASATSPLARVSYLQGSVVRKQL